MKNIQTGSKVFLAAVSVMLAQGASAKPLEKTQIIQKVGVHATLSDADSVEFRAVLDQWPSQFEQKGQIEFKSVIAPDQVAFAMCVSLTNGEMLTCTMNVDSFSRPEDFATSIIEGDIGLTAVIGRLNSPGEVFAQKLFAALPEATSPATPHYRVTRDPQSGAIQKKYETQDKKVRLACVEDLSASYPYTCEMYTSLLN